MFRSFLILLIIFLGISALTAEAQKTDEFHLDEVYAIDSDGTINLKSDDAEVRIIGSDRTDVHVKIDYRLTVTGFTFGKSSEFEMIVQEKNGNLTIREKPRDFGNRGIIGTSKEEYTILIEAPRNASLNIRGDDETYDISGIDGSLRLNADDTDIDITDSNGDEFVFSMDDGNLRMDRGKGTLKIDIDDGDVEIGRGDFTEIEIDSDDSYIEITNRFHDNGYYTFDMDDGDLRLSFAGGGGEVEIDHDNADVSASSSFEQLREEDHESIYRLPGGNARIRIYCDDGDIELRVI